MVMAVVAKLKEEITEKFRERNQMPFGRLDWQFELSFLREATTHLVFFSFELYQYLILFLAVCWSQIPHEPCYVFFQLPCYRVLDLEFHVGCEESLLITPFNVVNRQVMFRVWLFGLWLGADVSVWVIVFVFKCFPRMVSVGVHECMMGVSKIVINCLRGFGVGGWGKLWGFLRDFLDIKGWLEKMDTHWVKKKKIIIPLIIWIYFMYKTCLINY